jgi:hypothetical protein
MNPVDPLNVAATAIFVLAIVHTFLTARVMRVAHHVQQRHDDRLRAAGSSPTPSILANGLHFIGEVELVFGLWVIPLILMFVSYRGWEDAKRYINDTVNLPGIQHRHHGVSGPHRSEGTDAGRLLSGGLVIHGGLQAWWIAPLLSRLSEVPLFLGSTLLTAFNDNALITYLGTLVPNLDDRLKIALVEVPSPEAG